MRGLRAACSSTALSDAQEPDSPKVLVFYRERTYSTECQTSDQAPWCALDKTT